MLDDSTAPSWPSMPLLHTQDYVDMSIWQAASTAATAFTDSLRAQACTRLTTLASTWDVMPWEPWQLQPTQPTSARLPWPILESSTEHGKTQPPVTVDELDRWLTAGGSHSRNTYGLLAVAPGPVVELLLLAGANVGRGELPDGLDPILMRTTSEFRRNVVALLPTVVAFADEVTELRGDGDRRGAAVTLVSSMLESPQLLPTITHLIRTDTELDETVLTLLATAAWLPKDAGLALAGRQHPLPATVLRALAGGPVRVKRALALRSDLPEDVAVQLRAATLASPSLIGPLLAGGNEDAAMIAAALETRNGSHLRALARATDDPDVVRQAWAASDDPNVQMAVGKSSAAPDELKVMASLMRGQQRL